VVFVVKLVLLHDYDGNNAVRGDCVLLDTALSLVTIDVAEREDTIKAKRLLKKVLPDTFHPDSRCRL
jgi:hypothetical protein